jgi:CRP/FNR family transcriptional regulator, cyclic AMP receptor protein
MNKFRKLGLISYNGKIEVHNSLLNAVLHEKPEIERDDSTGAKTGRIEPSSKKAPR